MADKDRPENWEQLSYYVMERLDELSDKNKQQDKENKEQRDKIISKIESLEDKICSIKEDRVKELEDRLLELETVVRIKMGIWGGISTLVSVGVILGILFLKGFFN